MWPFQMRRGLKVHIVCNCVWISLPVHVNRLHATFNLKTIGRGYIHIVFLIKYLSCSICFVPTRINQQQQAWFLKKLLHLLLKGINRKIIYSPSCQSKSVWRSSIKPAFFLSIQWKSNRSRCWHFSKISSFVLHKTRNFIQVWNNIF